MKNTPEDLIIEEPGNEAIDKQILDGLKAYNRSKIGPYTPASFTIYIKSENAEMLAGLNGEFLEDVCNVKHVWVDEHHRNKGLGKRLIYQLEQFLKTKNCPIIQLYTAYFQAKDFYEKLGFTTLVSIEKGFMGHSSHFMRKVL